MKTEFENGDNNHFVAPIRNKSESSLEPATRHRVGRNSDKITEKLRKGHSQARIRVYRRRVWTEFNAEFDARGKAYLSDRYFNPELSAEEFLFFRYYMTDYKLPIRNAAPASVVATWDALKSDDSWCEFHDEYAAALLASERAAPADMRKQVLDGSHMARENTFSPTKGP